MACSTHVEMFLHALCRTSRQGRMLHARGDVSSSLMKSVKQKAHAPRTWRCFPFLVRYNGGEHACSTHVEMFPPALTKEGSILGMLHARGDVSFGELDEYPEFRYAPRTWRCFRGDVEGRQRSHVCSTYVEMFQFLLSLLFVRSCQQGN